MDCGATSRAVSRYNHSLGNVWAEHASQMGEFGAKAMRFAMRRRDFDGRTHVKVFTSQSLAEVELMRSVLEDNGIASIIRNEFTQIGRGDIPFTDTWPELWLIHAADQSQAVAVLRAIRDAGNTQSATWICPDCGETIEGQFSSCWSCQSERSPG